MKVSAFYGAVLALQDFLLSVRQKIFESSLCTGKTAGGGSLLSVYKRFLFRYNKAICK